MKGRTSVLIERAVEASIVRKDDRDKLLELANAIDLEHQHALFDAWHVVFFVGWLTAALGSLVLLREATTESAALACAVSVLFAGTSLVFMSMAKRGKIRFAAALTSVGATSYSFFAALSAADVMGLSESYMFLFSGSALTAVSLSLIRENGFPALSIFAWGGLALVAHTLIEPSDEQMFLLGVGGLTLFASYLLNVFASRNYTFWLNKVGLLSLALGMREFVDPGRSIDVEYLGISLGLICLAIVLGYPSYAFSGVVGLTTYVGFLVDIAFRDQELLLGVVLIGFGAIVCYCASTWRGIVDALNFGGRFRPKDLPTPYMFGID